MYNHFQNSITHNTCQTSSINQNNKNKQKKMTSYQGSLRCKNVLVHLKCNSFLLKQDIGLSIHIHHFFIPLAIFGGKSNSP